MADHSWSLMILGSARPKETVLSIGSKFLHHLIQASIPTQAPNQFGCGYYPHEATYRGSQVETCDLTSSARSGQTLLPTCTNVARTLSRNS